MCTLLHPLTVKGGILKHVWLDVSHVCFALSFPSGDIPQREVRFAERLDGRVPHGCHLWEHRAAPDDPLQRVPAELLGCEVHSAPLTV